MDGLTARAHILFDLRQRTWSPEVLWRWNIDPTWLPETFEGTAVTGTSHPRSRQATGLPAGIPVMAAAAIRRRARWAPAQWSKASCRP
jgi:sugar (pentulose or hexulose) kinase